MRQGYRVVALGGFDSQEKSTHGHKKQPIAGRDKDNFSLRNMLTECSRSADLCNNLMHDPTRFDSGQFLIEPLKRKRQFFVINAQQM